MLNWRNGGRRLTIVPDFIKIAPKDGTISDSSTKHSNRERRYYSLTLAFVYLGIGSLEVVGRTIHSS